MLPASTCSTISIVAVSVTRMPRTKRGSMPGLAHGRVDLRAAAVDDHRVHADVLEQRHVLRERVLQLVALHGVTAVLDDEHLAGEAPDVRQRLEQQLGLLDRIHEAVMPGGARGYNPRRAQ